MKTSPLALARSRIASFSSSLASLAEAHERERARRASSQPGSASTSSANSPASRTCSRIIRCSPERPWQRRTAHSFSERKRRPSTGPYSRQAQRVLLVGRAQELGDEAEGGAEVLGPARPQQRAVHRREHPLVGVDDERVGALDARERPAELGAHHRAARVGGVDVQPRAGLRAQVGQRGHRIDRGGRGGADGGDHDRRVGEVEPVDAHAVLAVRRAPCAAPSPASARPSRAPSARARSRPRRCAP